MSTLHVAWIVTGPGDGSSPGGVVEKLISSEAVTTSGTSAKSAVRPAGATHALVTSIDANHYVTGQGLSADASATFGVAVYTGDFMCFRVDAGEKIAAITI